MKTIVNVVTQFFAFLAVKREEETGIPEPVYVPVRPEHSNPLLGLVQWFIMAVGIQHFFGWVLVLRFLLPAFVFMTSFFASEDTKGFIWITSAILLPGAGEALMELSPKDGHTKDGDGGHDDDESDPSEALVKLHPKDGDANNNEESTPSCAEDDKA